MGATMTLEQTGIPFLSWERFFPRLAGEWKQGEHLSIIGPTGLGKTTLALNLLPLRRYIVVFATKPRDDVMRGLIVEEHYKHIKRWTGRISPVNVPKRVLWPDAKKIDATETQKAVFKEAFHKIYTDGAWTLFLDEMWYLVNHLNLGHEVRTYLLQARSLKISLMLAAQRPAWVPVEVFDQSTHLFFFRENDHRNLKRIASIGFLDQEVIQNAVAQLPIHHCLYINSRTGEMLTTKAPKKEGV